MKTERRGTKYIVVCVKVQLPYGLGMADSWLAVNGYAMPMKQEALELLFYPQYAHISALANTVVLYRSKVLICAQWYEHREL